MGCIEFLNMNIRLVIIVIIFSLFHPVYGQDIEYLFPNSIAQEDDVRIIKNIDGEMDRFTIRADDTGALGRIRVPDEGLLFLTDFQNHTVLKINLDDHASMEVIGGAGRGPGEFMEISGYAVDVEDRQIIVSDHILRRLTLLDFHGEVIGELNVDFALAKVAMLQDGIVVKNSSMVEGEPLFIMFDRNLTSRAQQFDSIKSVMNGVTSPLIYEGIVDAVENRWIYASRRFGVLRIYNHESGEIIERKTIEPINGLILNVEERGQMRAVNPSGDSIFASGEIAIDNGKIYVMHLGGSAIRSNLIDVYDLYTGDYLHSLELHMDVSHYDVHNGIIYALIETDDQYHPYDVVKLNLPSN